VLMGGVCPARAARKNCILDLIVELAIECCGGRSIQGRGNVRKRRGNLGHK
jgi:hypothetical protein